MLIDTRKYAIHLYLVAFLIKVAAGICLWYVYKFYYPQRELADIFKFYDDALILKREIAAQGSFFPLPTQKLHWWFPAGSQSLFENRSMILFNLFCLQFFGDYYFIPSILACVFAMYGLILLHQLAQRVLEIPFFISYLVIFFLPSVLFWTSGLLKDSFAICGLAALLYGIYNRKYVLLGVGIMVLLLFKIQVLVCIAAPLCAFLFAKNKKNSLQLFSVFAIVNVLAFVIVFVIPDLLGIKSPAYMISYKRGEFIYLALQGGVGSLLYNNFIGIDSVAILSAIPQAITVAVFRPFLNDWHGPISLIPMAENIFFLSLWLVALIKLKGNKMLSKPWFWLLLNYGLLSYLLLGLCCPVLGSLIRYKVCAMPILFLLPIALILQSKKLTNTGELP